VFDNKNCCIHSKVGALKQFLDFLYYCLIIDYFPTYKNFITHVNLKTFPDPFSINHDEEKILVSDHECRDLTSPQWQTCPIQTQVDSGGMGKVMEYLISKIDSFPPNRVRENLFSGNFNPLIGSQAQLGLT
jgi:hypothetical protein